jgi:hypothetical protein
MKHIPLLLIPALLWQFTSLAAEPPSDRQHSGSIDVGSMLAQTELNVYLRQYEKALDEYYETRLQLAFLHSGIAPVSQEERDKAMTSPPPAGFGISKDGLEQAMIRLQKRIKVLEEWREQLRRRIEETADQLNKIETDRVSQELKQRPPTSDKSVSPSERAPRTQF